MHYGVFRAMRAWLDMAACCASLKGWVAPCNQIKLPAEEAWDIRVLCAVCDVIRWRIRNRTCRSRWRVTCLGRNAVLYWKGFASFLHAVDVDDVLYNYAYSSVRTLLM